MSGFASVYHQENNDAGLDDLLNYIVSPSTDRRIRRPSSGVSTLQTSEPDSDTVRLTSRASRTSWAQNAFGLAHFRSNSAQSHSSQNLGQPTSSSASYSASSRQQTRPNQHRHSLAASTNSVRGSDSGVKGFEAFHDRDEASLPSSLFSASTTTPRVHLRSDTESPANDSSGKHGLVPRDNARFQQYGLRLPSLSTVASNSISDEKEPRFPPHPGVRPHFRERDVLGEASGPTEDDDYKYPEAVALALILVGVCLSVFIISVNRNVVATAIPEITAHFQSYEDIGWYGSSYLLTASAFQPLYGRIYMAFDTKWTYLLALAIFEVGSIVCGASTSSAILIVGRAIQGLGSAGILTGSFVVVTHSVRLDKRPILFAGVGMLFGVGALSGPIIGGALTDLVTWRWCFYVNVPVGTVTFLTVLLCFNPRQVGKAIQTPFFTRLRKLDWIGNIILLGACTMLFLALQFSEERYSWSSTRCIGLIVGFGVTLIVFILWMFLNGRDALIPVHVARQRTVAASCGAAFFIYGGLLLHAYYLPIWFQAVKGSSAIGSGVNMVPYMAANAVFSLLAGIFVSKNGLFAPPAIIGCAIGTIGSGLLATLQPDSSAAKWAGYQVLVSAGLGMAVQQGFSAVQTALPLEEVPIGTAAVVASQSIGGAIFVSVGNTLLQNHLLDANNDAAIPGVNIRAVFELGATRFRQAVPAESLPALVALYNDSLQGALIAAVPLCGCAFLCSLCMEWRSVRAKRPAEGDGKA